MFVRLFMVMISFRLVNSFTNTLPRFVSIKGSRAFISTTKIGEPGTTSFRIRFEENGKVISPWHDIPLKSGSNYNFISEIPRFTKAKMEISTKEPLNPISQDLKKGKLRDYHGPIYWNYGCLPQTWEDPNIVHPEIQCKGDNDPLDVVEIGSSPLETGSVTPVKVLGALAMIDDGELDWKVIALRSSDPLSSQLTSLKDVEDHFPGYISGIREWFRWYKTPDLKPLNRFALEERVLDEREAERVIEETHQYWKQLKSPSHSPSQSSSHSSSSSSVPRGGLWISE